MSEQLKPSNRYVSRRHRVVIGLHHLGIKDMSLTARAMGMWVGKRNESDLDTVKATFCVAEVMASDNPTVKMWLRFGLPIKATAILSYGCQVRCPRCGATVSCVPCHTCDVRGKVNAEVDAKKKRKALGIDDGTDEWLEEWIAEGEEPGLPDIPTQHEPGSREKVELMARRFETGQGIHHPEDAKAFYEHGNGSGNAFRSVFATGFSAYREPEPADETALSDDDDLL